MSHLVIVRPKHEPVRIDHEMVLKRGKKLNIDNCLILREIYLALLHQDNTTQLRIMISFSFQVSLHTLADICIHAYENSNWLVYNLIATKFLLGHPRVYMSWVI